MQSANRKLTRSVDDLGVILVLQFRSVVQLEVLRTCQTVESDGLREPELTKVNNLYRKLDITNIHALYFCTVLRICVIYIILVQYHIYMHLLLCMCAYFTNLYFYEECGAFSCKHQTHTHTHYSMAFAFKLVLHSVCTRTFFRNVHNFAWRFWWKNPSALEITTFPVSFTLV